MADLGSDFSCVTDLDANMSVVDGRVCLAQALARRLDTPKGGLFYDPSCGYALIERIGAITTAFTVQQQIQNELLQDERVEELTATVTLVEQGDEGAAEEDIGNMTIVIEADDGDGPFDFVIDASVAGIDIETFEGLI